MIRRLVAALASAGAVTLLFFAAPAHSAGDDDATTARRAAAYLAGLQGDDGSVPAGWRGDQVAEAVVALAAGGGQPGAIGRAVEHLAATADKAASSGPFAGRIAAAAVLAGRDPRHFGGVDLVARIESEYDAVSGSYGGNVYGDSLAMLGLLAAGVTPPDGALTRLRLSQCRDGSWGYQANCLGKGDTDTTSMVLSVLIAAGPGGRGSAEVNAGRAWLAGAQRPSGCWGYEAGAVPNANSCGLALSAIAALGEQPGDAPWTGDGRDPKADLRSLQLPSGAFQYRKDVAGPNDYATVQAVPGLAGWAYPVKALPPESPAPPMPTSASASRSKATTTSSPPVSTTSTTTTTTTTRSWSPAATTTTTMVIEATPFWTPPGRYAGLSVPKTVEGGRGGRRSSRWPVVAGAALLAATIGAAYCRRRLVRE